MTPLLPLPAVAERLQVSLRLVQKLTRATEFEGRHIDDVPPCYRPYIGNQFPKPVKIGKTIRRIRSEDLERWISQQ